MSADWPPVKLGELADEITVGFVGTMTHEYVDKGIPFFRSKNISEYEIEWNDIRYISLDFHRKLKKSMLRPGDVAIVRTGKPGTACVIPDSVDEANCSDIVIVRVNNDKLSAHYLCYFMNSLANRQVSSHLVGAVQQHFNVASAKMIKIPLPTRDEQEKIVKTLKAFDDKRKLNRQIIRTLEKIAQAIFKNWFVDFEPVRAKLSAIEAGEDPESVTRAAMSVISGKTEEELDQLQAKQPEHYEQLKATAELFPSFMQDSELGEVPKGWKVGKLEELVNLEIGGDWGKDEEFEGSTSTICLRGTDLQKLKELGYSEEAPVRWIKKSSLQKRKMDSRDILIATSGIGPIGRTLYISQHIKSIYDHEITYSNFTRRLRTKHAYEAIYAETVIETIYKSNGMASYISGTSIPNLDLSGLLKREIIIPCEHLMESYSKFVENLHSHLYKEENKFLQNIRDTLLPKLLSGELEINDIDKMES